MPIFHLALLDPSSAPDNAEPSPSPVGDPSPCWQPPEPGSKVAPHPLTGMASSAPQDPLHLPWEAPQVRPTPGQQPSLLHSILSATAVSLPLTPRNWEVSRAPVHGVHQTARDTHYTRRLQIPYSPSLWTWSTAPFSLMEAAHPTDSSAHRSPSHFQPFVRLSTIFKDGSEWLGLARAHVFCTSFCRTCLWFCTSSWTVASINLMHSWHWGWETFLLIPRHNSGNKGKTGSPQGASLGRAGHHTECFVIPSYWLLATTPCAPSDAVLIWHRKTLRLPEGLWLDWDRSSRGQCGGVGGS